MTVEQIVIVVLVGFLGIAFGWILGLLNRCKILDAEREIQTSKPSSTVPRPPKAPKYPPFYTSFTYKYTSNNDNVHIRSSGPGKITMNDVEHELTKEDQKHIDDAIKETGQKIKESMDKIDEDTKKCSEKVQRRMNFGFPDYV